MVMALSELGNKVKMDMEMNNKLIIENGFDVEDVALYRMHTYVYSGISLKTSNITIYLLRHFYI